MPVFEKKSEFAATARDVFAWHMTPDALERLLPPWERVSIEKRPASLGNNDEAVLVLHIGPIQLRWVARHHDFVNRGEQGGEFTDDQVSGPFRRWTHRHVVRSTGDGRSMLEDRIEYELPLGGVGQLLAGWHVRRKLRGMFEYRHGVTRAAVEGAAGVLPLESALAALRDEQGRALRGLTNERPTLVVMLRHSGCTFCKQTLADLSKWQRGIKNAGLYLAIVMMSATPHDVRSLARTYGVEADGCFADPDRVLYRALELQRGSLVQLFGPKVIAAGVRAAFQGHGVGKLEGDGFQMPGAFVLHEARVLRAYRHATAGDRPDLEQMACSINA